MALVEYLLRFLKGSNAVDVQVTENSLGYNRFHIKENSICEPLTGEVNALPVGDTDAIYDQLATDGTYIYGFNVMGNTDATITLTLSGTEMGFKKLNVINQDAQLILWPPVYVDTGDQIKLEVFNTGRQTGNFKGAIYAETNIP